MGYVNIVIENLFYNYILRMWFIMAGFFIILLASLIQGITGFGFALVAVPLLSLFIPEIKNITPIIVIYSLITNIIIVYKSRKYVEFKKIIPLIIFAIIATPLGTYILISFKVKTLKIIIGIIIIITALAMLKNFKIKIRIVVKKISDYFFRLCTIYLIIILGVYTVISTIV